MTLRHLKVFVAVCENGGITRAADALHMVQPAVSTTISELEKYYKASLFDRINQRLVLTELGKELLVKAQSILAQFEDFEETATLGGQHPKLRIGSSLTLGKTVLPSFLTKIKSTLPQIEPIFIIDKTAVIETKLECGELDFGIVEGDIHSEHLKKIPFGEDRLIAVCSHDYCIPTEVSLAELSRYPLLLRERGSASRDLLDKALSEKHLSTKPFVESVSNEALISFAEAGHGLAVLPDGIICNALSQGTLKSVKVTDATMTRTHYLIVHKNKCFNTLCQSVFNALMEFRRYSGNNGVISECYYNHSP